ncbi:PREDICTED: uncharacterized protein LOC109343490 isoform X2 [Lupinus angustifolius]|uniref:uncharacterized protein LOC109343490 isoform X2 n=1 Tax=Lupinus angustifolius TaxID=3871 RepID=UPI00092E7986|nr:PREDICTED: uncharacterized protein LOC109343490 isoform X2 [Lupinus angustifolius]
MASVEGRAGYAANRFTQDFRMLHISCDHQSSVSKKLKSDRPPSNSINDHVHAVSGWTPRNANSDKLPDMKWWLHVKTNMEGEGNYTCQSLNSWESDLDAVYDGFLDDNVKNFDALSYTGGSNKSGTRMPKTEAALNNNIHLTPKKDQGEFYFSDGHFMDSDVNNFSISEKSKMTSYDLESSFMDTEKTGPWWRNAGKDELASLVAQKSLEHIENCDLPQPQTKHFWQRPLYPKGIDHDKTLPSSLNQKAETVSSNADSYTSGTPTSSSSFQDSTRNFGETKDHGSSKKDCPINSQNNGIAELMEALCHSQTRAREAEKAAQQAYNEKEHILTLFFRQASQLFAYKQWFHILQLENLCLQLRKKNQPLLNLLPYRGMQLKKSHGRSGKRKGCKRRRCGIGKCAIAFVVGLGLASAGLLLGWTMGWMFPPL